MYRFPTFEDRVKGHTEKIEEEKKKESKKNRKKIQTTYIPKKCITQKKLLTLTDSQILGIDIGSMYKRELVLYIAFITLIRSHLIPNLCKKIELMKVEAVKNHKCRIYFTRLRFQIRTGRIMLKAIKSRGDCKHRCSSCPIVCKAGGGKGKKAKLEKWLTHLVPR